MRTRCRPVDNGYEIIGSHEVFNRALYGGHDQDAFPGQLFYAVGIFARTPRQ